MPIHPITFCIPESKIVDIVPVKTKQYGTVIPSVLSTYVFDNERTYYDDYQQSVFGKTKCKGGWDCMRHYEILANGCIPFFDKLDECPPTIMTHFPKQLVAVAMKSITPEQFIQPLIDYTNTHLTTRKMAQYVLDTSGHSNVKNILFLSQDTGPDYMRCLLLTGFKQLVGRSCIESPVIPHIYDDYGTTAHLYGKGISYTKNINASLKPPTFDIDEIKSRKFDIIVYGSVHRGMPYWDVVNVHYLPSEIILVCGEDTHNCSFRDPNYSNYNVFIRELVL